jgi:ABC-type bacteriocin/lantibiotic exporter with double-glycine peptidase domain
VTAVVLLAAAIAAAEPPAAIHLPVPLVAQEPERCGPAALAMVLRYYGADSAAVAATGHAYHPALRGALITDLAQVARSIGFSAAIVEPPDDSLSAWLQARAPVILLYPRGVGPVVRGHYGVLVGWEPELDCLVIHDGGSRAQRVARVPFLRRWRRGGGQALLVRPASP